LLFALLEEKGVAIHAEPERKNWWRMIFIGFLPWLLIIGLILYSVRKFQGGMGGAKSIGHSA